MANQPSGTGPYKFDRMVPHERLEFVPNADPGLGADAVDVAASDLCPALGVRDAGGAIFITSMCFNLVSDGLRSAMDVRIK